MTLGDWMTAHRASRTVCPRHNAVYAFHEHDIAYCYGCMAEAVRAGEPPELHEASAIIARRLRDISEGRYGGRP